jgi:cell migration-inducing and hyaluronan-binding protein
MGGQSTFNRSSLTVNHGTYYLDTSVTDGQQNSEPFSNTVPCPPNVTKDSPACAPRSVNVFEKGQTYYMFFVFAKTTTRQTYQIYVGSGFNPNTNDPNGDLHAVRVALTSRPVNSVTNVAWPADWTVNYNDATACANNTVGGSIDMNCGILQITIDMKNQTDLDLKPKNGLCLPSTFCASADGATGNGPCGGNPAMKSDPSVLANPDLWGEIDRTCKVWAVRDLDYPTAGPLGFSFKMPNAPDGMSLVHRPFPTFFPTTPDTGKPDWVTQFARTATSPDGPNGNSAGTGACYYAKLLINKSPLPAASCAMPTTAEGGVGG